MSQMIKDVLQSKGYELCGLIGEGATAQVYYIKEVLTKAEYACKISSRIRWIGPEAELLKSIQHPLFPKWKAYWEVDGKGYLVMEYITGSSLENHLRRRGILGQEETVRIALELADGLRYLHEKEQRFIYRDLKPDNIMIQPDGKARLLDLGAVAIPENCRAGTIGYAAPEQQLLSEENVKSIVLTPVSDIYSLGMVMHYMLTGRNPLLTKEEMKPVRKYDSGIWFGLDDIINRCISILPQERIPGMRELMTELSRYYRQSKVQIVRQEIKVLLSKRKRQKVIFNKDICLSDYKNL